MKTHRGYKCEVEGCDFQTEKWSELGKHKKAVHKAKPNCEKPTPCPICQKVLSTRSSLRIHLDNVHHQSGDCVPVFQCGDCDKEYLSKSQLTEHYKTTHQNRRFTCSFWSDFETG